ncbi:MAG: hypothetical protein U5J82_01280 [Desulfobacterales bacterium]|nr:hypothetical protein [Desulfobacterales bacterium]
MKSSTTWEVAGPPHGFSLVSPMFHFEFIPPFIDLKRPFAAAAKPAEKFAIFFVLPWFVCNFN